MNTARRGFITLLRVAAALVFCYAGWIKIRFPQAFADSIATFQLLPSQLINPLALGLPPFEMIVGALFLTGWKVRTAAFCAVCACMVFLLALISAKVRGLPVECGCFGDVPPSSVLSQGLWLAIGRDLLLTGSVLAVYLDARRRSHPEVNPNE